MGQSTSPVPRAEWLQPRASASAGTAVVALFSLPINQQARCPNRRARMAEGQPSEREVLVVDRIQHAAGGELAYPDLVAVEEVVRPGQNGGARLVQRLHVVGGQGQ